MKIAFTVPVSFDTDDLFDWLEAASPDDLDRLDFGLVALASDGTVEHYNLMEAKNAGLSPARIIGRHFFQSVAQCANNAIVGHRFENEPLIDDIIDYVFVFRLTPRKVRLRLMKRPHGRRMYLGIEQCD